MFLAYYPFQTNNIHFNKYLIVNKCWIARLSESTILNWLACSNQIVFTSIVNFIYIFWLWGNTDYWNQALLIGQVCLAHGADGNPSLGLIFCCPGDHGDAVYDGTDTEAQRATGAAVSDEWKMGLWIKRYGLEMERERERERNSWVQLRWEIIFTSPYFTSPYSSESSEREQSTIKYKHATTCCSVDSNCIIKGIMLIMLPNVVFHTSGIFSTMTTRIFDL